MSILALFARADANAVASLQTDAFEAPNGKSVTFTCIKHGSLRIQYCNQPYTMTPEQAARAARTVKPKVLFPYHYGETPVQRVADLLDGSGIDVRIRNYQ